MNMNKYFLVLLLSVLYVNPMSAICDEYTGWDWGSSNPDDWKAYLTSMPTGNSINMSSPFINTLSSGINEIVISEDYTRENGWVLLMKEFGCPDEPKEGDYPYFILYNKFRAIVRVFQYNNYGIQQEQALVTMAWQSNSLQTSLLTHNDDSKPNEAYFPQLSGTGDKALNIVNEYQTNAWFVTEFIVAFDHYTDINKYYELLIETFSVVDQKVKLSGDFEFSTVAVKGDETTKTPINRPNAYEWAVKGQKVLKKVPSAEALKKKFKQLEDALLRGADSIYNNYGDTEVGLDFSRDLCETGEAIRDGKLKKIILSGASIAKKIDPILGTVVKVFDLFIGKPAGDKSSVPQTVKVQPTISTGNITLTGNIKTQTNASNIILQLPGGRHPATAPNGLPHYDCPLGVFSLEKTPPLEIREFDVNWGNPHNCRLKPSPLISANDFHTQYPRAGQLKMPFDQLYDEKLLIESATPINIGLGNYAKGRYKSLVIKDDLEIAVNAASGLKVKNIYAAFTGEIKGIGPSFYEELFRSTKYSPTLFTVYHSVFVSNSMIVYFHHSPLFKQLQRNNYELVELQENSMKFSTKLIPIEYFKNTSFLVPANTEVALKIVAEFEVDNTVGNYVETPVIHAITYDLDESKFISSSTNEPYLFTEQQVTGRRNPPAIGYGIKVTPTGNVTKDYEAEIISSMLTTNIRNDVEFRYFVEANLTNGFSCENQEFEVKPVDGIYSQGENGAVINYYFQGCN